MFTTVALGPEEVCGILVGGDCGHPYDPWTVNWTVTFPDVPKPSPNPPDIPKASCITVQVTVPRCIIAS